MTGNPSETYTAAWFKARERYRPVYHAFAEAIEEVFHPTSVADIGCGAGYLLEHWIEDPPRDARIPVAGVDGSQAARAAQAPCVRPYTWLADSTNFCLLPPPFCQGYDLDLAVSIEVAEHIPAEHEAAFLSWFDGAQRVLFTAAPPGQRGTHHVNCQPPEHWIERFMALGFESDSRLLWAWRGAARRRTRGCPWVVRNATVFVATAGPWRHGIRRAPG